MRSAAPARASPGRSVCAPEVEATVSPDGSRLVSYTSDGPAVHVWDLRLIRHRLAEMRLDWDAPPFTDDDPGGPSLPPLPPLKVDLGLLDRGRGSPP